MVVDHHERAVSVAVQPKPSKRTVSNNFGGVAMAVHIPVGGTHGWVVIGALAVEHFVIIKPLRLGAKVPLADYGGLIARLLQQYGKRFKVDRYGLTVGEHTIFMTMQSG
jgi:hypothetical protein